LEKKTYLGGPAGNFAGDFTNIYKKAAFKPSMSCKLVYAGNHVLSVGTAGIYGTEYIYRLNSLYDPDFSGAGAQPYSMDQVALLYRKYLVSAVKIEIVISDPSEDGLVVGALLQPSNGSYTLTGKDPSDITERPMCCVRNLNNSGSQVVVIKQFIKLHKLEGLSPVQWECSLANYAAAFGANPSLSPYIRLAVANIRSTGSGSVVVRPKITYYCKFWERIDLAQS